MYACMYAHTCAYLCLNMCVHVWESTKLFLVWRRRRRQRRRTASRAAAATTWCCRLRRCQRQRRRHRRRSSLSLGQVEAPASSSSSRNSSWEKNERQQSCIFTFVCMFALLLSKAQKKERAIYNMAFLKDIHHPLPLSLVWWFGVGCLHLWNRCSTEPENSQYSAAWFISYIYFMYSIMRREKLSHLWLYL